MRDCPRLIKEGEAWWRHTMIDIAELDGDQELAERLKAENDKAVAALTSKLRSQAPGLAR
jgi:hypothetical protein